MNKLGIAIASAAVISFGASTGFFALMNSRNQADAVTETAVPAPAAVVETVRPEPVALAPQTPAPTVTPSPSVSPEPTAKPEQTPSPLVFDSSLKPMERIDQIRVWYRAAQSQMAREGCVYYGLTAAGLWRDGELIYARTHEDHLSPAGEKLWTTYFNCYFVGGEPYFMVVQDRKMDEGLLRLYYWDGKLIRWIYPDGRIFEGTNEEFSDYYATAQKAYTEVMALEFG